jgi:uncharacterized membrane protein
VTTPGEAGVRIAPMLLSDNAQFTLDHARNAAYDIVLLAHVLAALVGLGAVVVAGAYALALWQSGTASEVVRRYYRPGVNWGGRVLYLVPVLGVALVAMSDGDWSYADGWVLAGLMLWALVALAAEMVLWPAERKIQAAVADPTSTTDLRAECGRVTVTAAVVAVLLVVATVVMVAKP